MLYLVSVSYIATAMPSTQKTPANSRKKVTASARARISTRKIKKQHVKKLNESYIQSTPTAVSMDSQGSHPGSTPPKSDSSEVILTMLSKLTDANQALLHRIETIEQNQQAASLQPSSTSIPTASRGPISLNIVTAPQGTLPIHHEQPTSGRPQLPPVGGQHSLHHPEAAGRTSAAVQLATDTDIQTDGVTPLLDTLRRTPSISEAVTQLLEPYEGQAKASLQGRPHNKKSGRYNTTDIVHTAPELRWPNEGYHAPGGKKRVPYDELTLPQWVEGQLSNIFHMRDQSMPFSRSYW